MKIHFIALVGGSGSGKTWLAERLCEALPGRISRLALDDFYRDLSHLTPAERERVNFDHPRAIDWDLFGSCLTQIRRGRAAECPRYDFVTHTRRNEVGQWQPTPIVLVDGLWLPHRAELRRRFSLTVFVDCPEAVRLERRLARDLADRGRGEASIRTQFYEQVVPMHRRFVTDQARHAEILLESPISSARIRELTSRVQNLSTSSTSK